MMNKKNVIRIIDKLRQDAIYRVGEVIEVNATLVKIKVSKGKNLSYLMSNGNIVKNVGVGSHIEIKKDYLSYIGKIIGEETKELSQDKQKSTTPNLKNTDKNRRCLNVQLFGYIDNVGNKSKFNPGVLDLPLIGNEAFVVTKKLYNVIHNLGNTDELSIDIAQTQDGQIISLPLERILNSHIAIFGNTGSGKSNTLASLLQNFFIQIDQHFCHEKFKDNSSFLIFDFNGEYTKDSCLTSNKTVHTVSGYINNESQIPVDFNFFDDESLSILGDATDKTQKPFLKRMFKNINNFDLDVIKSNLMKSYDSLLAIKDKDKADRIKNLFDELLIRVYEKNNSYPNLHSLSWDKYAYWNIVDKNGEHVLQFNDASTVEKRNKIKILTNIFQAIKDFEYEDGILSKYIDLCYVQLIQDNCGGFNQHDFVLPVIYRLKSRKDDIDKIFKIDNSFKPSNIEIFNFKNASSEMKKIASLLLVKNRYEKHLKSSFRNKALFLIIDEAHTVLSKDSKRESEIWKDHRLEVFEEIVKEGRKFGVFLALSSQRPRDISETIISQIHNFFIHRLVNDQDLKMISKAVTYIDKLTSEELPILPTGTCIFSGIASNFPIKLVITPLPPKQQPQSQTLKISSLFTDSTN